MDRSPAAPESQTKVLQTFSRALGREAHVLTQHPDLLWQQMYNRLQWEEIAADLLAAGLERHRASNSSPWIKLKTHIRESGTLVRTFKGHLNSVTSVAHSPDGRYVASISGDNSLRVWEIGTGQIVWILSMESRPIFSVVFSPDGKYLACATLEGKLLLIDASTGLFLNKLNIADFVIAYAFSPNWRLLVTPGLDSLHLWEVSSGRLLHTITGHTWFTFAFAFSPDGQSLVSAGYDEPTLKVWDITTNQLRMTLEGHQKQVLACAFSPEGRFIASTSEDNSLRVWDAVTGRELWLQGSITNPNWCVFSPDGRFVGSAYWGNALRVWDTLTGAPVCTFEGHTNRVQAASFLPDGRHIVSASYDNTLRLWILDWELEDNEPSDWDDRACPHLENFLTLHTPYAGALPQNRQPTENEITLALTRRGKPAWTEEDFRGLLHTLGCAGYGWLKPEGVRRELERMAAERGKNV